MAKIFYDTEFLETGKLLDLISIGMVTEDGYKLYLINEDADWDTIIHHKWLRHNVVSKLEFSNPNMWATKEQIASAVLNFIQHTPDPELWAWYGAFDHVCLAWLYGPMNEIPEGIPYWTNDLRQEYHVRGLDPEVYKKTHAYEHHALVDALELRERYYDLFPKELDSD